MRLFLAVDCSSVSDYFLKIQDEITGIKASYPKTFHLTLKFLGDVQDSRIPWIKEKLDEINFKKFSFNLDKIGFFPSNTNPRIAWIGTNPQEPVIKLQSNIDNSLSGLFKKETRFHPHITIARIRFVKDKKKFTENLHSINTEKKEIAVDSFTLIKSTLTAQGPIYEEIERFNLTQ